MIWSLYAMLGTNMWYQENKTVLFEEEAWKQIVNAAIENGINQIVLDLGEGIEYGSHPELARPGAWSRQKVHEEVQRLRALGIEIIPKLNFSATHHLWLGEYRKMVATSTYYQVCRDLIQEVYALFEKPAYIHLGMDEEGEPQFFERMEIVTFRRGELLWHDIQYLCDCVRDLGAIPWIWADSCLEYPEEFRKHIRTKDIVLSPWYYRALKKEHYTPITSTQSLMDRYSKEPYKSMNLTYVEETPFCVRFMQQAVPAARDGYAIVPCVSTRVGCEYNTDDVLDYFRQNAPEEYVLGFMTAPWLKTQMQFVPDIIRELERLKEAREKYYNGK